MFSKRVRARIPTLIILGMLLLAIFINIAQLSFLPVIGERANETRGNHLKALYVNKDQDIIDSFSSLSNVRAMHGVYIALRKHTPNASLELPYDKKFRYGGNFLAGALGIGKVQRISHYEQSLKHYEYSHKASDVVASGETWDSLGDWKNDKPGTKWQILTKDARKITALVGFYDVQKDRLTLVDKALVQEFAILEKTQ